MIKPARLSAFIGCFLSGLTAVANAGYTACEECAETASISELAAIELRVYPDATIERYTAVPVANAVDLLDQIDSAKPTVLYVSGWTESPDSISVETVLAAYFERDDHNVLLVDYRDIAGGEWDYVAASAEGVGYTLAIALDEMVARGLKSSGLHIVGHSLGGQVSGFIGKYANFTLARITALDPAGPSFEDSDDCLSSSDAYFVDVIHTNCGVYGMGYSVGTADFYPNGNSGPQPGCEDDSSIEASACSHYRSWYYYAESLINENSFIGVACESDAEFKAGSCSSGTRVVMGYATPATTRGNFHLQTNDASPYGRGEDGTTYEG